MKKFYSVSVEYLTKSGAISKVEFPKIEAPDPTEASKMVMRALRKDRRRKMNRVRVSVRMHETTRLEFERRMNAQRLERGMELSQ